jgi:hypothetical protein
LARPCHRHFVQRFQQSPRPCPRPLRRRLQQKAVAAQRSCCRSSTSSIEAADSLRLFDLAHDVCGLQLATALPCAPLSVWVRGASGGCPADILSAYARRSVGSRGGELAVCSLQPAWRPRAQAGSQVEVADCRTAGGGAGCGVGGVATGDGQPQRPRDAWGAPRLTRPRPRAASTAGGSAEGPRGPGAGPLANRQDLGHEQPVAPIPAEPNQGVAPARGDDTRRAASGLIAPDLASRPLTRLRLCARERTSGAWR